jgi:hypothetical protein
MLSKLFWLMAVVSYAAAVYLASTGEVAGIDFRFWLLIALGTLSAVIGNTVRITDWDQGTSQRTPGPQR